MGCVCEMIGLACILALILSFSSKAPYQLKMATFMIGSGAIVLICIPLMIFRPRDYRNAFIPAWGCRQLCKALGVTMEVRGLENIRTKHGAVVLINHQSFLDLCGLAYLWPVIGRATVVSKKEVLFFPFFGFGAWLWGTLFINRSSKKDSINTLQKESRAIQERNCKLLFFPEGTRNTKETLLPFKKGPFHIALQSQCPIQPVVISKYYFLNGEKKSFRPGHAIIYILPEIHTAGSGVEDMDNIIQNTRNTMDIEYKKLSQEIRRRGH
ncbi:1-acyl-sn-glycerol-3-phosphate acyltransferase alpha [Zeugodacus cucurbitae]|uniref:1-acyl-sn-glycerol-3-phosphate acyltransferase n=1 Tax=Zeugodacus cucurbitae TaxID=28588 RepID=A0A0A1XGA1_ZEUCU|nr:1-acyl-sn-glycerol-3-phosphate acyltransferase alpha [Zeugodacus cucurbitae]XP_011194918.1 1-acyl-sn-glycerol-3-phosphate acyltransferase alpha [Zeugodacus cucurbitae]XP_028901513.1 1-acyl-sn-glycerol-3-phosphate acyltransferase alpha [Zeugodacus cucurbitae]XP_028901514.1 1-acyl-sn-glycerol-3-phosphate acyltransferase alpha [Zeugodacus cucurbitae]XP_054083110.1 1-acyl-sn-glycerol-3-phosphate acyltransferase alpha [Zeugodacus cucurbitae]XP_054083111.1 1-acyl-sn-glycerol-3-phosphate acyltrans